MPIFRKNDGAIQESPNADDVTTQVLDRQRQRTNQADFGDLPTDLMQDEPPTVINSAEPQFKAPPTTDDPKTTIFRPNKHSETGSNTDSEKGVNGMDDPVVGWVVITKGAGQGFFRPLGYGQNSIGRNNTERVSLDFGANSDSEITRVKHATITYDPKGKKYYLHSGDGTNLTYLNDAPVLTPVELTGGEEIVLGDTTLYFVPFCGEKFDWQSNS